MCSFTPADADIGIAMVSTETPSDNGAHTPNLFTIRVGDN